MDFDRIEEARELAAELAYEDWRERMGDDPEPPEDEETEAADD